MKRLAHILLFYLFLLSSKLCAQFPTIFPHTIENGAPGNEVYWLIQDAKGYIWFGSDVGVYRYNGARYEHFASPDLSARSATGLIQSSTTYRIYGYNFNRQLFYIENDKLYVIKGWDHPINGIAEDGEGSIWITGVDGLFRLNETTKRISKVESKHHHLISPNHLLTSHGIKDLSGRVVYQNANQILFWKQNKVTELIRLKDKGKNITVLIERNAKNPTIVSVTGDQMWRNTGKSYKPYFDAKLFKLLKGKKLNCLFGSKDGKIWIGTYTGLICHNPRTRKSELMFPEYAISHGMEDREGNFWFSTLHHGVIRVPNMHIRNWKPNESNGLDEQYTHAVSDNSFLYIAGSYGRISQLDFHTDVLEKYTHEPLSDVGTFYYDPIDHCTYFNKLSILYRFKGGRFELVNEKARPVKKMLHTEDGYFILSSQGLYFVKDIRQEMDVSRQIDPEWFRDICLFPGGNSYLVASNMGVHELQRKGLNYKLGKNFLPGKQVICLTVDDERNRAFIYAFDGGIYELDAKKRLTRIHQLEEDVRVSQLQFYRGQLYLATNKGVYIFDPTSKAIRIIDHLRGLASNNIRSILFQKDILWAVGEHIHRIPISSVHKEMRQAYIIARGVVRNESYLSVMDGQTIPIQQKDRISILADGITYRSNGEFNFAYRFVGENDHWYTIPGQAKRIDLTGLPSGETKLEIKVIDGFGMDSCNSLILNFEVVPPYWQRWWFYVLVSILTLGLAVIFFRIRIGVLQKKQVVELNRLRLENELRLTQQNALKAQMNPHFLFNVLNSIKGFIYENDKHNAAKYLGRFSSLVRKVLELSSLPKVSLEEELEALQLYIELEAMLLSDEFTVIVDISESIDAASIDIPALILQPYVENAFKHGLRHKKGPKELRITIRKEKDPAFLRMEISDNGIGRKKSEEINKLSASEHESFASVAMKERIDLLNFDNEAVIGVEIIDNLDGETPSGTTVILRIYVG